MKLHRFLEAVTNSISVDSGVDAGMLRSLALRLRGLGVSDVTFITAPVAGTGRVGDQSVVYLDQTQGDRLYGAIHDNTVPAYLNRSGQANQVGVVR